ncbi:MAG: hypothetical protein KBF88_00815, partial [Polyangiaceae bacterium]|nr:hypothetical protein [Polyangiaceae bacterium]
YTLPGDGYFGRVAVSADETVFATYAQKEDGGGLSARMISFRYDLPSRVVRVLWDIPLVGESYAAGNSPSIAANGDLYVAGEKSFTVYSRAGKLLRSFPIAGARVGSSPLILASGNAIVKGASTLYAFSAVGEVWKHALPSGSSFVGEPLSDGLLSIYAPVVIGGLLTGKILKLSETGVEGGSITTHARPIGTPTMRGTSLYAPLSTSLIAVSSAGNEFFRISTKALGIFTFGVSLPDSLYYFNDGPSPSIALTISTGQVADLSEPNGTTAVIGTASEDLVYIDHDLVGDFGTFMVAKKKDGSIRWRHKISADTSPEPQAVAMGGTGILYAGAHNAFYAVGQQSQLR